MSALDDLRHLSAAEEIFAYLNVSFDAVVLDVARLHILRRMGEYLAREPLLGLSDSEVHARCRAHLQSAYADFVARSPLEQRVFKVHKDAAKAAERTKAFVPLTVLTRRG